MMIRAFFAIDLPASVKETLKDLISALQKQIPHHAVRWVAAENLHITLRFISQLKMEDVSLLIEKVSPLLKPIQSFELMLGPLELFPSSHHPRVISLQVRPQEILAELSAIIDQEIGKLNYPLENRPFKGHLTLGRLSSHNSLLLPELSLPSIETMSVNKVILFQSNPQKRGSRYIPLDSVLLS